MIMGSNMAECHPVAFRWPMKAKENGAKLIHVDPRFTRTSAMCDIHAPIRAGTDIVFLGALINYIINSERWNSDPFFQEYVVHYSNAATLITEDYQDPEDLDGLFSGFNAEGRRYDFDSWAYQRGEPPITQPAGLEQNYDDAVAALLPGLPKTDPGLQDPQTVFQIMKRHYARYTPEMVENVCGCPEEKFLQVAETLLENSGREGKNLAAARVGDEWVSPQWGFAWPANRHIMYSRASADAAGNPWSERKKYTYWDPNKNSGQTDAGGNPIIGAWVNVAGDSIDFPPTKAPDAPAKEGGTGLDAHDGASPAIMKPDGKFWLFAPSGAVDGPMPTHYEPWESPVTNPVYGQQRNPVAKIWEVPGNPYHNPEDAEMYPIVVSTYRLTEHYLSGTMSRWLPWLAELMPELFVEMSHELAEAQRIQNGDWVTVVTARGEVEGRALVTRRMRPFVIAKTIMGLQQIVC